MSGIQSSWHGMAPRNRVLAVVGLLVPIILTVTVLGGLALNAPTATPAPLAVGSSPSPTPTFPPLPPTPSPPASATSDPSPSLAPGADPLLGTDGRLTVLLLGTDYRPAHPGNRTDAMMVVSIDPTTGVSAAFSVPRDVASFPLPKSGTYGPKVNGLYQYLDSTMGDGASGMKQAFARAFGIEIDRYVLIGFNGVIKLVRAVGGVDVTLSQAYYDPYYWVTNRHRGWGLPAGKSHLNADDALIFARSRKGDSDFSRAKRQQMLVMAAVAKVRSRGLADLPKLIDIAKDTVRTDLPLARAADLYALFSTVDLTTAKHAVFGPKTYAAKASGTDYLLRLDACKKWIAANFPPARPFGSWPAS
jgi:polyisoprenyl-teichoic acid--peptidoglycan teichoic acid transferase